MGEFITWERIALVLSGIAAIWGWYHTQYWPFKTEQWKAKFEASQADRRHSQKQEELTLAYYQSEASVAHQQTSGMLQESQEFVHKVVAKELDHINNRLGDLKGHTDDIPKVIERLEIISNHLISIGSITSNVPDINRRLLSVERQNDNLLTYARMLIDLLKDKDKI